jgi:ParB-like nuclease domain
MHTILIPMVDIYPSPENAKLYHPVDSEDPAVLALSDSIAERGLLEPLVVTSDHYIISGHRRYTAARLAGLDELPCRISSISRTEDPDGFIVALREHNRQRVKSLDETIREAVVSANPEVAYQALLTEREQNSQVAVPAMHLRERRARKEITDAKYPFLNAIIRVLNDLKDFWPVSERQIHYNLLNDPPLKNTDDPDSTYRNDKPSAKNLSDLCTRARIAGLIPEDIIGDETRPVTEWRIYPHPGAFIDLQLKTFMVGYRRDLLRSQPHHIELLVEKNSIAPIVEPVAGRYGLTMTSGRGYASLPPRINLKNRFKASGKDKLVLLIVSDFDPEGEDIAHSFSRSMRDDFHIDIHPVKIALTLEQTKTASIPVSVLDPKEGSSRTKRFIRTYGADQKVFELEASPPRQLQEIVSDAIDSVIDVDLFNAELRQEKQDATQIQARRQAVVDGLNERSD